MAGEGVSTGVSEEAGPSTADHLLDITPSKLVFPCELFKELYRSLALHNPNSDSRIAFKFKTTAPDRYVVSCSTGIVEPLSTRLVNVYMHAQAEFCEDALTGKDRFLVQAVRVSPGVDEKNVTSDLFKSGAFVQEALLEVCVTPALAQSSVLESEIRAIALAHGTVALRQALRKFAELLYAQGLLNQAEVVLAFGAVGQMFAGLSDNGAMDSTQLATTASVPDKALSKVHMGLGGNLEACLSRLERSLTNARSQSNARFASGALRRGESIPSSIATGSELSDSPRSSNDGEPFYGRKAATSPRDALRYAGSGREYGTPMTKAEISDFSPKRPSSPGSALDVFPRLPSASGREESLAAGFAGLTPPSSSTLRTEGRFSTGMTGTRLGLGIGPPTPPLSGGRARVIGNEAGSAIPPAPDALRPEEVPVAAH